jgi:hypothetical protein
MMVTVRRILAITYDVIRNALSSRPPLLHLRRRALLLDGACRLKERISPAFGRTAGGLRRFARDVAILIWQILRGAATRARGGLARMSREIALEALWIKQGVRRILRVAASIACWPIRTSGLLVLTDRARRQAYERPSIAFR